MDANVTTTVEADRRRKIATVGMYGCMAGCAASFGLIPLLGLDDAIMPMFCTYIVLIAAGAPLSRYGKLGRGPNTYRVPFEYTEINPGTGSPMIGGAGGIDTGGYAYGANAMTTRRFSSTDP